jgi:hypothetical protein
VLARACRSVHLLETAVPLRGIDQKPRATCKDPPCCIVLSSIAHSSFFSTATMGNGSGAFLHFTTDYNRSLCWLRCNTRPRLYELTCAGTMRYTRSTNASSNNSKSSNTGTNNLGSSDIITRCRRPPAMHRALLCTALLCRECRRGKLIFSRFLSSHFYFDLLVGNLHRPWWNCIPIEWRGFNNINVFFFLP